MCRVAALVGWARAGIRWVRVVRLRMVRRGWVVRRGLVMCRVAVSVGWAGAGIRWARVVRLRTVRLGPGTRWEAVRQLAAVDRDMTGPALTRCRVGQPAGCQGGAVRPMRVMWVMRLRTVRVTR